MCACIVVCEQHSKKQNRFDFSIVCLQVLFCEMPKKKTTQIKVLMNSTHFRGEFF
jgi:hypothetical protein